MEIKLYRCKTCKLGYLHTWSKNAKKQPKNANVICKSYLRRLLPILILQRTQGLSGTQGSVISRSSRSFVDFPIFSSKEYTLPDQSHGWKKYLFAIDKDDFSDKAGTFGHFGVCLMGIDSTLISANSSEFSSFWHGKLGRETMPSIIDPALSDSLWM